MGKSTLVNELLQRMEADLSVSMTTRPMTKGDVDGEHYYFVNVPTFERSIKAGELLEHAVYAGNFYGTPRSYVEEKLAAGRTVIVEIDVEGARQVKQSMPESFAMFIKARPKRPCWNACGAASARTSRRFRSGSASRRRRSPSPSRPTCTTRS